MLHGGKAPAIGCHRSGPVLAIVELMVRQFGLQKRGLLPGLAGLKTR